MAFAHLAFKSTTDGLNTAFREVNATLISAQVSSIIAAAVEHFHYAALSGIAAAEFLQHFLYAFFASAAATFHPRYAPIFCPGCVCIDRQKAHRYQRCFPDFAQDDAPFVLTGFPSTSMMIFTASSPSLIGST